MHGQIYPQRSHVYKTPQKKTIYKKKKVRHFVVWIEIQSVGGQSVKRVKTSLLFSFVCCGIFLEFEVLWFFSLTFTRCNVTWLPFARQKIYVGFYLLILVLDLWSGWGFSCSFLYIFIIIFIVHVLLIN